MASENVKFSKLQHSVIEKYLNGENIFISGPGGTGKSQLIKYIYEDNKEKTGSKTQVCALTGCAAILLECNATTIHAWSGVSDSDYYPASLKENFSYNWRSIHLLIVDEVSMMSKTYFEKLNHYAQLSRRNNKPFGGIQVIFAGDFFQLPPINKKEFCFESDLWNQLFPISNQICLKKIFRQTDKVYSKILNQIREGCMTRKSLDIISTCLHKSTDDLEIKPVSLHAKKKNVDFINNYHLDQLDGRIYQYNAETSIHEDTKSYYTSNVIEEELNNMKKNSRYPQLLSLKQGAKVMCLANLNLSDSNPICNGSQGIVIDFTPSLLPIVKFDNGTISIINYSTTFSETCSCVAYKQIPLTLAWAITIHKAQGVTLDSAEIYVGDEIFEEGQTYVAISRIKSLEGLYLKSFNYKKILVNHKVKEFYNNLKVIQDTKSSSEL